MSIVRKIVGWVRGLGNGPFSLRKIPTARASGPVVAPYEFSFAPHATVSQKAIRLADISRRRTDLKRALETAKRQKTRRRHIYAALEALRTEELKLESGQ